MLFRSNKGFPGTPGEGSLLLTSGEDAVTLISGEGAVFLDSTGELLYLGPGERALVYVISGEEAHGISGHVELSHLTSGEGVLPQASEGEGVGSRSGEEPVPLYTHGCPPRSGVVAGEVTDGGGVYPGPGVEMGLPGQLDSLESALPGEIGRASCRERV